MMNITGLKISKFLREMRGARSVNTGNANFELTVGQKTSKYKTKWQLQQERDV
jgi:hypothetical protein